MTELRKTEGTPIWLPGTELPGTEQPHLVKRERRAYGANDEAQTLIEMGLFETGSTFVFRCPLCGRQERNDQRLSPACTGPSWTDEHAMEEMILVA